VHCCDVFPHSFYILFFYFLKLYLSIFLILSWLKISLCNFFSLYIHLNGVGNHCSPTPKINVDYNSNPQCIPLFFFFYLLSLFFFLHFFIFFQLSPFFFIFFSTFLCFLFVFCIFFSFFSKIIFVDFTF